MARAENTELIDRFEQFYRNYYRDEIGELAQNYPNEKRSLYINWNDLYQYDADIADDYLAQPQQLQEYAEEALRLYDLPVDVSLGQAHVRLQNLPEHTDIRAIRARHVNTLVSVQGIVRKATGVRPKIQEAAFECQRCGTLTYIPQAGGDFQEPHECQGCERQGPFRINFDQSEFIDSQKLRIQESPEGLRGGETPQSIDVHIEDDITGHVSPGDHVTVTGILHLEQQGSGQEKSAVFDVYMDGVSVEIEDEEFEDMDITDEDKQEIIELSNEGNIYEQMVGSIAPAIYGYEQEKLAMIFQLFSGVTKHLPDGSRIRGDLHMLLIGDPGTGKSQMLSYIQHIAPRSVYTSGKGSSSAGLTAAAVRDDFGDGQQWTLEAGALVLADKGIAAVDELDKMSPEDRSAMHEGLEQQKISVSQGGDQRDAKVPLFAPRRGEPEVRPVRPVRVHRRTDQPRTRAHLPVRPHLHRDGQAGPRPRLATGRTHPPNQLCGRVEHSADRNQRAEHHGRAGKQSDRRGGTGHRRRTPAEVHRLREIERLSDDDAGSPRSDSRFLRRFAGQGCRRGRAGSGHGPETGGAGSSRRSERSRSPFGYRRTTGRGPRHRNRSVVSTGHRC